MKEKEKNEYDSITVTLPSRLLKKLDEGKFNKSKLIDDLLTKYFKEKKK
jgi:metal-responsive CopG/Arc/MetJ family transcriptional regulator